MFTKDEIQTIETKFRQRIERCRARGDSYLNLAGFELNRLGENRLADLMREIPKNITTLDLNKNDLYRLGADGLKTALQSIPESITTLDLSNNQLDKLGAEGLQTALQGIPKHVTTLDLSNNGLDKLDLPALAKVLATIPNHVTCVHLGGNGLFINKSTKEIDAFLRLLGENRHRYHLSGNGESQLARALAPMALLTQENSTNNPRRPALPRDVVAHILSFLETRHKPENQIRFFKSQLQQTIDVIATIYSEKISALINLCSDYKAHLERTQSSQHHEKLTIMQKLEAILQDNKKKPDQRLSDFAKCFSENRSTLQEHRDSISTRFIASILHVLSLGLYSKFTKGTFAFWRSHGDIVCDKLEKALPHSLIS
ncbi:hypothetical protein [Legionella waltersii]|uniref:VipE n=1 Tax=Legionella waltersii TaxID=66969 RepID=A0A0W1A1H3_9GAMM|nr:hypothetical protein [Legionella waltersii]KTD75199.1 VipE [Legionella waltersii]SNV10448.1 VipE [Legionella waltersii]